MSDFFDKIRALKDGLFGKKEAHEDSPSFTPPEAILEESTSQPQERAPYYIQIGFDFGTSFSKCVYREVSKDKAWVYCSDLLDSEYPFLIPSTIIYKEGVFRRHVDMKTQYPQNGLFHLKFAIERIASDDINAPVLNSYKAAIKSELITDVSEFVQQCAVFFLSTSFAAIVKDIKSRFRDYGHQSGDQLAINMAVPVADASQEGINSYYNNILKKAWILSEILEDTDYIHLKDLSSLISECNVNGVQEDLCAVYPEVSANVQAFIRAPASSPNPQTIYFLSDTGAGTVDQSVFTYPKPKEEKNDEKPTKFHYFAAEVLPLGSSLIEKKACGEQFTLENMEYWRKKKEDGVEHAALSAAKECIEELVRKETYIKTLHETQKRLPSKGRDGSPYVLSVNPISSLQSNVQLIFSGGGHQDIPYESGVIKAFNQLFNAKNNPNIVDIRTPPDLNLYGHGYSWMKRLFVAYGLSFPTVELAENTYPHQNILEDETPPQATRINCTCKGISPNCPRCYGRGWCD